MILLAVVLACIVPARAHDSEPINTEFAAPFTLKAGNIQFGAQWFRDGGLYEAGPMAFEYGFAPRQQFSIELPMLRSDEPGKTLVRPGNLQLGYRYLLAGGMERKFAVSLNPSLGIPSGDKRVAERAWTVGGAVHLDTHLADRFFTHTNIGYETPVADFIEKEKNFFYRFAAMYEATESFQPVLELVGEHDFHSRETRLALVPEGIVRAGEHWEIKGGIPVGLTSSTPDVGVQVQVTWKFGEGR
ncbi:MAG TPA: hypothetical protein VL382_11245, partial [Terriglobales bacterium]|nr:hypothetical protein [Terriglobales bacterium]